MTRWGLSRDLLFGLDQGLERGLNQGQGLEQELEHGLCILILTRTGHPCPPMGIHSSGPTRDGRSEGANLWDTLEAGLSQAAA